MSRSRQPWIRALTSIALLLAFAELTAGAGPDVDRTDEALAAEPTGRPTGIVPGPGGGLEKAIDGSRYRLGPGDILALTVFGPVTLQHSLPVTLEGKIVVPDIGEVTVDGLLLDEAKDRIRALVLKTYPRVEIGVSFVSLRKFQVHVLGQVEVPGTYLGTAVDRVSDAIEWAGGMLDKAGVRRIQVTNGDTLRATADLFSFLRRGVGGVNPTLIDGDVIYVPFMEDRFSVLGAVNENLSIGFIEGDTFGDAIELAGGFSFEASVDTVEVARYPKGSTLPERFLVVAGSGLVPMQSHPMPDVRLTGERYTPTATSLPGGRRPTYADFYIQPNDLVFVRRIPYIRRHRLVEIDGEVRFPGQYPVHEGVTRLSDVIRWAGGLTNEASLVEATLIRREAIPLKDLEYERLKTIPVADMREDEYTYFKMKARTNAGQMVVDFPAALEMGDPEADVLLERGDQIFIPKRKEFVTVLGMVVNPGNVRYELGLSAEDYVDLAGGFAENARKGRARVIRVEGGEWAKLGEAKQMKPGDTIMVPEKPERDWWQIARETLIFTTQILAVYIVIDNATN